LDDPNLPVSMGCDRLNLVQFFCVGSIDQCRTFGNCDLSEMLKMYEIFGPQFRVFGFLVHFDQKVGSLTLNLSFKLEVDFFSHNLQNSQEAAGKTTIFCSSGFGGKIDQNFSASSAGHLRQDDYGKENNG